MRVLESGPNTLVFHGNHFVEVNENEATGEMTVILTMDTQMMY